MIQYQLVAPVGDTGDIEVDRLQWRISVIQYLVAPVGDTGDTEVDSALVEDSYR